MCEDECGEIEMSMSIGAVIVTVAGLREAAAMHRGWQDNGSNLESQTDASTPISIPEEKKSGCNSRSSQIGIGGTRCLCGTKARGSCN